MTTQTKTVHSPGPWKAEKCFGGDGFDYVIFSGGSMIASTMGTEYINEETDIANANLMAAAPEMLEALERALPCCWLMATSGHADAVAIHEQVRAAIQKARGGQ
jgi:hypothetical protein